MKCQNDNFKPGAQESFNSLCSKTKTDDDADKKTGVVSHVSQRPTHSPYWGESVTVNMDGDKAGDESKYHDFPKFLDPSLIWVYTVCSCV